MADIKKNIGVYICTAYKINEAFDCKKLADELEQEEDVLFVKLMSDLLTERGAEKVREDIKKHELTAVIIGGSSPRFHTELFTFHDIVYDRVNLREGIAWTHKHGDQHTYDMAKDYMMMGLAKVRVIDVPAAEILDINETIMVVGGGVAGLNAAIASSKAGKPVVLVEKSEELGGYYRKLHKLTPADAPYTELQANLCEELISEVEADPHITIMLNTSIEKTTGQPGMFDITAHSQGEDIQFQVGAIIQATGWNPYNPHKLDHLGYGRSENIITNLEMEKLAKDDKLKVPSSGKDIESIVFIQCAGSRDKEHLSYCSGYCCMTALKQAMYVREKYPDARIYVIYKDLRTPGQYELFYKRVQSEDNIFLTKGEVVNINVENGKISIDINETLVGEEITIEADMAVLATGMQPSTLLEVDENGNEIINEPFSKSETVVTERGDLRPKSSDNGGGGVAVEEAENAQAETAVATNGNGKLQNAPVLNLTYIQGKELPQLHYGFPDSHYICFPYETRRTGIYAAGTVRQPMDIAGAVADAYGAALKAVQIIENIKNGTAVHPRSGDVTFPDFFFQRCTQCKRCTEECPFSTLDEDVKGTPLPNLNRCRRCGICMGACPERIISFKNYSVRMISDMIKSIYIPTEEEDGVATPRILCFMCENDAYPSLDVAAQKRVEYSPHIRVIPVRCLGSVNTSWIADSLSQGFDGVMLFGCKYGDDYQCHFIKGSELANKRMENVQEKMKQLVLEPERVELHMLSIDEYDKVPGLINKFAEVVEELGPNPYKEM